MNLNAAQLRSLDEMHREIRRLRPVLDLRIDPESGRTRGRIEWPAADAIRDVGGSSSPGDVW